MGLPDPDLIAGPFRGLGVDLEAQRTGVGEALPHRAHQVPVLFGALLVSKSARLAHSLVISHFSGSVDERQT